MGKAGPLIVFGITLVVGGGYWALWDGSRSYFDSLIVGNVYYELMYWGWRILPAVLIIVGIMCLISAGIAARGREVMDY